MDGLKPNERELFRLKAGQVILFIEDSTGRYLCLADEDGSIGHWPTHVKGRTDDKVLLPKFIRNQEDCFDLLLLLTRLFGLTIRKSPERSHYYPAYQVTEHPH